MQLIDLVRDVIANPTAYANAFPVSEPTTPTLEEYFGPDFTAYHRQLLGEMVRQTGVEADFSDGLPRVNNLTATGEAIQRDNENAYNRPPRGLPRARFSPWENGPDLYVDPTIDPNRIYFVRHPRHYGRRLDQSYWGDGSGEQAWFTDGETRFQQMPEDRPDHYRVRAGECVCGFRSIYRDDMDEHIDDTLIEGSDGVPKRWKVCERCGASRLCRRVPVATGRPISFNPVTMEREPAITEAYHCDNCVRGIRDVCS